MGPLQYCSQPYMSTMSSLRPNALVSSHESPHARRLQGCAHPRRHTRAALVLQGLGGRETSVDLPPLHPLRRHTFTWLERFRHITMTGASGNAVLTGTPRR